MSKESTTPLKPRTDSVRYGRWLGGVLMLIGVCLGILSVPGFVSHVRSVLSESQTSVFDVAFAGIDPTQATWLRDQSGGRWGPYGWVLRPNEEGRVILAMPGQGIGHLAIRIWANDPGSLSVRLISGGQAQDLAPSSLGGRRLRFAVAGGSRIEIAAKNTRTYESLVLDRVAAVWSRPSDGLPIPWSVIIAVTLLFVGGIFLWKHCVFNGWELPAGMVFIGAAVTAGFLLRYDLLDMARALTNEPDVVAYKHYAESFEWFSHDHGFYSGSFGEREPLHVALLNAWMGVWGRTFPAIRWYTVLMSTLVVAGVGFFTWKMTQGWVWGALAAWVTALNPVWIEESVKGLRLETMTLLLLMALSLWVWGRGWNGAIALGVTMGAMALLQLPLLSSMIGFCWCAWVLNRFHGRVDLAGVAGGQWTWRHLLLISCLSLSLFVPHLYGVYRVHGDPFWGTRAYARWNANMEFPDRLGTVGFPTVEEFRVNPYAGPSMTYLEYLFGLHAFPQLVWGQLKGWTESTIYMSVSGTPGLSQLVFLRAINGTRAMLSQVRTDTVVVFVLFLGLTMIGWISLWRNRDYWWVPFFSLLGTWYAAYLYSVRLVEPFRHTGHVYPLLLVCLVMGGKALYSWVTTRLVISKTVQPTPS